MKINHVAGNKILGKDCKFGDVGRKMRSFSNDPTLNFMSDMDCDSMQEERQRGVINFDISSTCKTDGDFS